jgi:hypothetical protein|tara:strand:- start:83 stop:364 length:282 start_codon:yes stop_codon:yes gene_type:complete
MSKIDIYTQTDIYTQSDNVSKKKGRPKIYTDEEALEIRRQKNREYQKKRYQEDAQFRQMKIEKATIRNPLQYEKLKEKMQRLKELEAIVSNNK